MPTKLGDLDEDGQPTVLDLVRLINHINSPDTLAPQLRGYADATGDGYINQADIDMLADAILGIPIPTIPRPIVSAAASGASEVGVTVRPRVDFPKPIIPATLSSNNFYASFAGKKLPATIVAANDGTFAWLFFETNMPNASQVQVTVDGSTISVISGEILDADADLAPGGLFKFNFSTVSVVGIPNTVLTSLIVDPGPDLIPRTADDVTLGNGYNYLFPIQGVKVYVLGMEVNVAYTDANGRFTLTNMPVGNVKVVLDGRTATNPPAGYYFPEMVMDTTFSPGITNGVMTIRDANGNEVRDTNGVPIRALAMYLPRVASNVLQTVNAGITNLITLQSNAAYNLPAEQQQYVTVEIMPNSLIGMDGQPLTTGQVGISVVPPELVRDMLPPGVLQHTFDITVQAPGISTFSTPAPMTFPNVFNAPPGTKLNFLSFDHTTGRLVIEGTATVSEDGLFVRTDPGTGITHPGWHGLTPPGSPGRHDIPRGRPRGRIGAPGQPGGPGGFGRPVPGGPTSFVPGGPGGPGGVGGGGAGPALGFQILLSFVDTNLTAAQRAILTNAARRWEQIIVGDLPNVLTDIGLVDDIVIDVRAVPLDGPRRTIVRADPTYLRSSGSLSARGRMEFDTEDLPSLESSGQMVNVTLHEMAHVLGFGNLWQRFNLLNGASSTDPTYVGLGAMLEYGSIFLGPVVPVPVENTGYAGRGTNFFYGSRDAHWRESVFDNELMTSLVDLRVPQPLSRITARSFADLGYTVNVNAADLYAPPPMMALAAAAQPSEDLQEEPLGEQPTMVQPAGVRLDFGTPTSPVTTGFTRATDETTYTAQGGFGWFLVPGTSVAATDRGSNASTSELTQDFISTRDATFLVDVTNGIYDVTLIVGDAASSRSLMLVYAEDELRGNISTTSGQFITNTYRVIVVDRQLTLRFQSDSEVALNALEVKVAALGDFAEGPAEPLAGKFFFAIEDLETGFILRGSRALAAGEALCPEGVFLAPSTRHRQWVFHIDTGDIGVSDFTTPASGQPFQMPAISLGPFDGPDTDDDGLIDLAEWIIGTIPGLPDSDNDGVSDLAEIQQGLDPLSGRAFPTGVIASLSMPGEAKEVVLEGSTLNSEQQTAYVALGSRGLGVVNASQFQMPILVGQLDLPGDANDVAVDSSLRIAAVAADAGGLHLVSVTDPLRPALVQTLSISAGQVEIVSGLAYVAVGSAVNSYDVQTGARVQTLSLGGAAITGLASEGLFLYTMDSSRVLCAIDISEPGSMVARGSLTMLAGSGRLFVGGGIAYVAAGNGTTGGFATANVSSPDNLQLISGVDDPAVEGQAVVANGSGLTVAVGHVRGPMGEAIDALDVLNGSDPANTDAFLTRFNLPATPFSVAIGAGIAFVADGTGGLQVVNYSAFDNLGTNPICPRKTFSTSLEQAVAEAA